MYLPLGLQMKKSNNLVIYLNLCLYFYKSSPKQYLVDTNSGTPSKLLVETNPRKPLKLKNPRKPLKKKTVGLTDYNDSKSKQIKWEKDLTMMNNIIAACLTKKGVPCIFPFMLAGDFFLGCTDFQEPSKKPWCATKVQKMLNSVHINILIHCQGGWTFKSNTKPVGLLQWGLSCGSRDGVGSERWW